MKRFCEAIQESFPIFSLFFLEFFPTLKSRKGNELNSSVILPVLLDWKSIATSKIQFLFYLCFVYSLSPYFQTDVYSILSFHINSRYSNSSCYLHFGITNLSVSAFKSSLGVLPVLYILVYLQGSGLMKSFIRLMCSQIQGKLCSNTKINGPLYIKFTAFHLALLQAKGSQTLFWSLLVVPCSFAHQESKQRAVLVIFEKMHKFMLLHICF